MSVRLIASLAVLGAAGLLAAGCGGEDDGNASSSVEVTTGALNKPQFVKQANAACSDERSDLLEQLNAYAEENGSITDAEGSAKYVVVVETIFAPMFEAEVEAVQALGAPAGEEKRVERALQAKRDAIRQALDEEVQSFEELEAHFEDANRQLFAYKLNVCTVGSPPPSSDA